MAIRDDREDVSTVCSDCGQDVGLDLSHVYAGPEGVVICWACALRRGGTFDEKHDRWVVPPDTATLPDERRPHP